MKIITALAGISLLCSVTASGAETAVVPMHKISASGVGEQIGTVTLADNKTGLDVVVNITGIQKGDHGFHVHENGDCGPGLKDGEKKAGLAAGGHFDPTKSGHHRGPGAAGHAGDLPKLSLSNSTSKVDLVAEKVFLNDIRGRSLIIHEGGDNYSDSPEAGGGGNRLACGIIPGK